ncbi:hypothetical protein LWI29_014241 [Acer saccharum]|uniref:Uncharacterized protein n=1 Tax=Acer saccharum TaxID=4024 RepID=A0AA39VVJ1_ACESA|nr:hypothetical protein LWI29_014241 [Acer saccharum]
MTPIANYHCIPHSFPCLEDNEIAELCKEISEKEVSYGRNRWSNNGPKFAGKRGGYGNNSGQMDSGYKIESGPFSRGNETSSQDTESIKEIGKNISNRSSKTSLASSRGVMAGGKTVGGSRFEILNVGLDMECNEDLDQNQSGVQGKPNVREGLVEISNIENLNRKKSNSPASKYLVNKIGDKSSFNKALKENVRKGNVKMSKKGKQQVIHTQSRTQTKDMDEDLQDSEVLKIFHREVSQVRVVDSQSPFLDETSDNIVVEKVVDTSLVSSLQQVDITCADTFDVVASKLKEAMEVALEQ